MGDDEAAKADDAAKADSRFAQAKGNALYKADKSGAGHIDPRAVSVCAAVNAQDYWFTTSSCSGRCYLWRGVGVKATTEFRRGRVSHDLIDVSYFLDDDSNQETEQEDASFATAPFSTEQRGGLWLRFEPFILHTRCRTRAAAAALARAAREGGFKNVGVSFPPLDDDESDSDSEGFPFVSVVGDEGLEMPLRTEERCLFGGEAEAAWLVEIVNEKHERNWAKTRRFEAAVRESREGPTHRRLKYDVVGDVAILALEDDGATTRDYAETLRAITRTSKKVRVLALETSQHGRIHSTAPDRARERAYAVVAGPAREPLVTTHSELGVRIVVDLNLCWFSPKLALERQRLCHCVQRGERVLCLFCGCGPEALAIAARTDADSVDAVDVNHVAVRCLRRSLETLRRSNPPAAAKLRVFQNDALDFLLSESRLFDRILAPRPKHPSLDGDNCPSSPCREDDDNLEAFGGPGGRKFLDALLRRIVVPGGTVHWTDFAADWELPSCQRTRTFLADACHRHNLHCDITYVAKAGPSVAKRQFRVAVDFRVSPLPSPPGRSSPVVVDDDRP